MQNSKPSIFETVLKYQQIPLTLVVILCIAGAFSFINIPKQEFPAFTVLEGLIVVAFPGASSELVDTRVTKPLQDYLFSYPEVDRKNTYAVSKENQCVVFLYIKPGVNPDTFWPKLRIGLQEFKTNLPTQALLVRGISDFGDVSTMLLSISSEKRTWRELENYLNGLSSLIRSCEEVSRVAAFGLQKEEISIYVDEQKLAFYGLNPSMIITEARLATLAGYGAAVTGNGLKMPIRLPGEYKNEADLAEQIILVTPAGDIVRIKDIAEIKREYVVDSSFVETSGKRAVGLSISMAAGNNVMSFGKKIDAIINEFKSSMPADIEITRIADQPNVVSASIIHFFRDFVIAILSVIIVIILFLPKRIAAVAALTIPVTILISMTLLRAAGVELNTVSLAALVLVLGMVVDDPIVIIDNHVEKLDEGIAPWTAAWSSAAELFLPITTATFSIIAAFVPTIFFLSGMFKEFITPAPITVAVTLFVSSFVAVFFVPIINYTFIKKGVRDSADRKEDSGQPVKKLSALDKMQSFYNDKFIAFAFARPRLTIGIGAAAIVVGLGLFALLPQQLFPKLEHSNFAVEFYFPEGSSLERTTRVTQEVAGVLQKDKRVQNVTAFFGESSPRFSALYAPQIPALNYAQLIVNTYTNKQTEEILAEFDVEYRDKYPDAHIRWKQLDFLPNDAPIEIQILSDDVPELKDFAREVANILKLEKDIIWVKDDWRNPLLAVNLTMNAESANRLGITKGMLALSVAATHTGIPAVVIWEGDYAKPVYIRTRRDTIQDTAKIVETPENILNQFVATPGAVKPVLIREIASIAPGFTEGQIVRRNGRSAITVSGDVAFGKLASPVFARVSKKINALEKPAGLNIVYAGQHEMEMETYIPFALSLFTSVIIIFILMLFQFKRLRYALLVMSTMPLAILGGALGLFIIGYPFGMTSFMGLIGLFGIVIRNGLILVSYANELREKGMTLKEAAIAAGERRMRPIFLTATAAAVGVVPLITSGSLLWGPLGSVICFGLVGSTLITLFVLPVAYWKFGSGKKDGGKE
jgi:multidrug efflux pump subunit AcrB